MLYSLEKNKEKFCSEDMQIIYIYTYLIKRAFWLPVKLMLYHAEIETPETVFRHFAHFLNGVLLKQSLH